MEIHPPEVLDLRAPRQQADCEPTFPPSEIHLTEQGHPYTAPVFSEQITHWMLCSNAFI